MTIHRVLSRLAGWAREGYPEWAARRGHVALIALCGRQMPPLEQTPHASS